MRRHMQMLIVMLMILWMPMHVYNDVFVNVHVEVYAGLVDVCCGDVLVCTL